MGIKDKHRKLARERFWSNHDESSYRCPGCGRSGDEIKTQFEIHHLNADPHDNSLENLRAYCHPCHCLLEGRKPSIESIRAMQRELYSMKRAIEMFRSWGSVPDWLLSEFNDFKRGAGSDWSSLHPYHECGTSGCRGEPVTIEKLSQSGKEWWVPCCESHSRPDSDETLQIDELPNGSLYNLPSLEECD